MNKAKQYNYTVSTMRAFAALLVISHHLPYTGSLHFVNFYLSSTTVPFFFLVAGYFSWDTNEQTRGKKILKHLKKMTWIYTLAYLFYYFISVWIKHTINSLFHTNISVSFDNWNILELLKGILLDIDPFASHLWFLYAMIIIYALLYIIHWDKTNNIGILLSIVILLISKSYIANGTMIAQHPISALRDFPLVYLGFYIHYLQDRNSPCSCGKKADNYLFLTSIILVFLYLSDVTIFCTFFPENRGFRYIAIFFFLFAIKYPSIGQNTILEFIGSKYTLQIYIFHIFIMHMWERAKTKVTFIPNTFYQEMDFIIVFLLTLLFCVSFSFMIKKMKNIIKQFIYHK